MVSVTTAQLLAYGGIALAVVAAAAAGLVVGARTVTVRRQRWESRRSAVDQRCIEDLAELARRAGVPAAQVRQVRARRLDGHAGVLLRGGDLP